MQLRHKTPKRRVKAKLRVDRAVAVGSNDVWAMDLVLDRVRRTVGYTNEIRVDQGSEFVSRDMDLWVFQRGVALDFSRPGKPTDNVFIEAFKGRLQAESFDQH